MREQLKGRFEKLETQLANQNDEMTVKLPEHSIVSGGGITKSNKKSISKRAVSEAENTLIADPANEASSK